MKLALLKDDFDGQLGVIAEMSIEQFTDLLKKNEGDIDKTLKEVNAILYQEFLKT